MNLLQNPNVVYLLLAGGLALGVLALASPGTGLIEMAGIGLLLAAGALIAIYGMAVNLWAVGVIILGAALFALAVHRQRRPVLLILAIAVLVAGSAYLFAGEVWWQPGVEPWLALIVSLGLAAFFGIAGRKVIEAETSRPRHDLSELIGAVGEAKSTIDKEGSVLVNGELWSARSMVAIPDGSDVKVVGREGFILEVIPLQPEKNAD